MRFERFTLNKGWMGMSWERGRQQGDWLGGCAVIRMSDALTRREARCMVKEAAA